MTKNQTLQELERLRDMAYRVIDDKATVVEALSIILEIGESLEDNIVPSVEALYETGSKPTI